MGAFGDTAFGTSVNGLFGGFNFLGFTNVGAEPNVEYAPTIPHMAFAAYQMMFAIITPALITGAFVERVRFKAFLVFTVLWATFVYDPVAHWVWGVGGILRSLGALDFAGGTLYITAGFSGSRCNLLGKRKVFGHAPLEPIITYLCWAPDCCGGRFGHGAARRGDGLVSTRG